jgi:hypothetical protein
MALITLQTIFQDAFPVYEQRHALPAHVRRAAHAIMQCRTAALGGHVQACPDGHMARIWYNFCRPQSCPQCAYLQTERWLALQRARLLACDHYHVIFTLPHDLNPLWLANVPVMTTLLFQAVRATLSALLADPKYLGAQPGILAALHTWSQTLVLHPHVHCLVTGEGLTVEGQWKAVRHGFLLPVRVVMAVFRGKLLAAIRQALARAELGLPEGMRPHQLLNLLQRLGHPRKTNWQRGFVSPLRAITLILYLSSAIHGIRSPWLPRCHRSLAMGDGGRTSPRRRHASGGGVQCQSHRTTSRVRNTHTPSPSASTTCAPVHPLKASWVRGCCSGRTEATSKQSCTKPRRRNTG